MTSGRHVLANTACKTACLALLLMSTTAHAWRIDRERSVVTFQVAVIGFLKREGQFKDFSGELTQRKSKIQVNIELQAASVWMKRASDAAMLRGPDFFDAERFPTIRFVSEVTDQKVLEQGGSIAGTLTLRGQQRREAFAIRTTVCKTVSAAKQDLACFSVSGSVKRGDYGMSARRSFVSDRVQLDFQIVVDRAASKQANDKQANVKK